MPSNFRKSRRLWAACWVAGAVIVPLAAQAIEQEKVLHGFHGGKDGDGPSSLLIWDNAGHLYGTTVAGGGGTECRNSPGCGTVYKIAPDGRETVHYAFAGGCDGANPRAGLVMDAAGNMFGTTQSGGICNNDVGFGTVFKLAPNGTETVLYSFEGGSDGEYPVGGLVVDGQGNLYGSAGGGDPAGCNGGCGFVFKVTPQGEKTVFYAFQGGSDGDGPYGNVIMDNGGNIYGTTQRGGGTGCAGDGCGTVFKLAPDGTETVFYAFQGGTDGWYPQNGVVMDSTGYLYGTTWTGGGGDFGTVFKVSATGTHSVLYSFQGGADGGFPEAGVILDGGGNLYGTTEGGGSGKGCNGGCGVVFEVALDGTETVLRAFDKKNDKRFGVNPMAGLVLDGQGNLYGTTVQGGKRSKGVVFLLKN